MRHAIAETSRIAIGAIASAMLLSVSHAAEPSEYFGRAGGRHRILSSDVPPGVLGQARLAGRGPVAGYYQPVAISGPEGAQFALSQSGAFVEPVESLQAGLLVGAVYRFQITKIPRSEGAELYPTVEVIDRTYPPPGLATRYPIQIHLDQEDFDAALSGRMVTRVIYLEDPQTATPMVQTAEAIRPMEISEFQDALEVADRLGRPVAIVRIGSVSPPTAPALAPQFFFGYPNWAPIVQPVATEQVETTVAP